MSAEQDRVQATFTFAQLPDTVLYADVSDKAVRLFALLHKYSTLPHGAVPKRATLAEQMHCSPASVDRALNELKDREFVEVIHRWRVSGEVVEADERPARNAERTSSRYLLMPGGVSSSVITPVTTSDDRGVLTSAARSEIDSQRESSESSSSAAAFAAPARTTTPASPLAPEPEPEGILEQAYRRFRGRRRMGDELRAEMRALQDEHLDCLRDHVHVAEVALFDRGDSVGNAWAWLWTAIRDKAGTCQAITVQAEESADETRWDRRADAREALVEYLLQHSTLSMNDRVAWVGVPEEFIQFANDFFDGHQECWRHHLDAVDLDSDDVAGAFDDVAEGNFDDAYRALETALRTEAARACALPVMGSWMPYAIGQRVEHRRLGPLTVTNCHESSGGWLITVTLDDMEGTPREFLLHEHVDDLTPPPREQSTTDRPARASRPPGMPHIDDAITIEKRRAIRDDEARLSPRRAAQRHETAMCKLERGGLAITDDVRVWAEHYAGCGCPEESATPSERQREEVMRAS